ncbi:hypothetical protein BDN71DRAFT_1438850 [Pleurotus eryngii]|uniref:Uncharacterized protein n=1 Tax=Pleurotus eryngii TaxID=5323 RepID=A0A9P6A7H3_PLEER|nr:hypothetical protein BDN71DRAFT_1438850 [Pleurotus eryngii]
MQSITFLLTLTLCFAASHVTSSPTPDPSPEPIDPKLAVAVASNHNMGCVNGCPDSKVALSDSQENGALSSFDFPRDTRLILASTSLLYFGLI